jgi:hypothetical protein
MKNLSATAFVLGARRGRDLAAGATFFATKYGIYFKQST